MYKFKTSKYKNALASNAKKEECITEFTVESPVTNGNYAAASAKLVAFCVGPANGGRIMVFDINAKGRLGSGPSLDVHSDAITDLAFSPFNHCRLATAGADNTVKIWDLPVQGITEIFGNSPLQSMSGFQHRPECIAFNPVAEDILAVAAGSILYVYNVGDGSKALELETECDLIQSISWQKVGKYIAVTTKDCRLLVCDQRMGKILSSTQAHGNHKESRVVWLGETNKIVTTGFSNSRAKEVKVWEVSGDKINCMQTEEFGSGTGILMPFYDEDTGMLFVAAKGDSSVTFLEFSVDKNSPLKLASQQMFPLQTKGMCMLPKLGVTAPECEVNRLFQLTQKMLVPVSWKVSRKALREFPLDLFPETASDEPALSAEHWLEGQDKMRNKTSLEPQKRKTLRLSATMVAHTEDLRTTDKVNGSATEGKITPNKEEKRTSATSDVSKPESKVDEQPNPTKYKPFTGVRKSIFRHWTATVGHPSTHVTNVGPMSLSVSATSDLLRCSEIYAAVPIKGPGGQISITDLSKPGRMTNKNSLILQNAKGISDLQWNPFDSSQLAVALESSAVKIWNIPKNQFGETLEEENLSYNGHYSKPVVLCYHPLAENVIASGEVESRILVWDVGSGQTYFHLQDGEAEIMSLAWSNNGKLLAASHKDKKLRIFDPRNSDGPIQIGPGTGGARSTRIRWTRGDRFLAVSGFDKGSNRIVSLHSSSDLDSGSISNQFYGNSPSVLMLHYDEDSSTLFFISKGDSSLHSSEISEMEPPHLFPLATFTFDATVQGISFISKKTIDPKKVEFAKAWCLTNTTLQPISFTVPRVKMDYFQDDIFIPTSVKWEKTLTASDWVKGIDKQPDKKDLRPHGMTPLSQAPPDEVKQRKFKSYDAATYKTDDEKKEELLQAMSGKLDLDKELEQDTMDGVDEDEWDDY